LIQNTHLQLVYCVKIPPNTGPSTPDEASTNPTTPAIYFFARSGVTSGRMIIDTL
jgi:hypothetical protein